MKKFVSALILATAVSFSGCGNSTDFSSVASLPAIAGPAAPVPVPVPDPAPAPVITGFFVDAALGSDTTGDFDTGAPFQTIQAAVAAAPTGATITVRPGLYAGGINLQDGQTLQGEAGGVRPQTTGPINLADGNTVDFMRVQDTPGDAIFGNNSNGATITNNEIADTTNVGVGITDANATGTWTINNNTITNADSIGIALMGQTGNDLIATVTNNTLTGNNSAALTFSYGGTGTVAAQITGNTMTGTVIQGATFEVIGGDTATLCFDITGNTNDDNYVFDAFQTSTIEVEELSALTTLNSGGAGVTNPTGAPASPAIEVPDGTCGF